ncbi:4Fe-4S ferredoxin [Anaeromyxobacter paludicola]|uniref:Electron transfer flavoprotein-ubiquinone oxidoreductase n=1 Tax=Anaeromyxobacter paludicola TaxID=2918171 RepID=A0ABM7X6X2_9BACT|nr:4Fe-4S ferredoxin [Anaeromyxobacter paludicola]BDG07550.1 hypothetical protein AMPC_06630 [Anaeromyxobacter paludicola]
MGETESAAPEAARQELSADVVCVGFGPAMGGFLTTLARGVVNPDGSTAVESRVAPGLPLQVICYERADDVGFGVSGVVTRARALRESFPELEAAQIPLAAPIAEERVLYLLDPIGASRRSATLRGADRLLRAARFALPVADEALELPWTPEFLHKRGGMVLSLGQLNQWVAGQVLQTGAVQIWPGTPVSQALVEGHAVTGVRLVDQGVNRDGTPAEGYLPGMDVKAALTVVGDGPVGPVGRQLDEVFGMPEGHHVREWAVGCKMVVDLAPDRPAKPGTVLHTFGFPEPEIFGFLYVHPGNVASVGIFVPSWFDCPARTSYRYLQHYVQHPALQRYLAGATLRSWGAKSIQESGRRGEPRLAGDGWARIGEGSGSTNVLTGSGVDEAWATGVQLAQGVLELCRSGKPFSRENLEAAYVARRRGSWVEAEGRVAERARDGFGQGVATGLLGMALSGLTGGKVSLGPEPVPPHERIQGVEGWYEGRIPAAEVAALRAECARSGRPLHDALMDRAGWPPIACDGKLLVSHQDALLLGGKVQAPPGYADHVVFLRPELCKACGARTCVAICSGQAITDVPDGVPAFDREKCVHCGACLWNCSQPLEDGSEQGNVAFLAGAGGLHSAEN